MKFRWTIGELDSKSNTDMIKAVLDERMSDLNPYSPLRTRLKQVYNSLESEITNFPQILEAVLSQDKILPALIGIDEAFDKMIEERLRQ